jgi:hypothetical protein
MKVKNLKHLFKLQAIVKKNPIKKKIGNFLKMGNFLTFFFFFPHNIIFLPNGENSPPKKYLPWVNQHLRLYNGKNSKINFGCFHETRL